VPSLRATRDPAKKVYSSRAAPAQSVSAKVSLPVPVQYNVPEEQVGVPVHLITRVPSPSYAYVNISILMVLNTCCTKDYRHEV
jgi:hypothetical protein